MTAEDATAPTGDESPASAITLVSDRGAQPDWVGVLHSILYQMAPQTRVIDLSHAVLPDDVKGASVVLARTVQYLAPGVIVVCVGNDLDPAGRTVAVSCAGGNAVFLGPDNGVLAAAVAMVGGAERAVVLDRTDLHLQSPGASDTGRDVLIPVAAQLATGTALDEVGSDIDPLTMRPGLLPLPSAEESAVVVEVLDIDHRGAVQLNAACDELPAATSLALRSDGGTRRARRVEHFSELATGELGVTTDPFGMALIAAFGSSAAEELRVAVGSSLRIEDGGDAVVGHTTGVELGSRPTGPSGGAASDGTNGA